MFVWCLIFLLFLQVHLLVGENESFKNRFMSVSMCHSYVNEFQPGDPFHINKRLSQIDPMYEACLDLFVHERPILAMLHNLLINNSTFMNRCKSVNLNETIIRTKLQNVWNKFTEAIGNEEWLSKKEICSLFTNQLNPMYCLYRNQECDLAMISSVYAFWYLYAEAALNSTTLNECYTLPHSFVRMKTNPLNPSIYNQNFDLSEEKILVSSTICQSHNKLWLVGRDARLNFASLESKSSSELGLKQFETFGQTVYEF